MSTPQTLPPKAVLRVLQGLLLGTSCSLAVLIEDRRRRINAVQAVLENGRKLKALPQYREGGTERAITRALAACNIDQETANALRESLVPDPSLFDRIISRPQDGSPVADEAPGITNNPTPNSPEMPPPDASGPEATTTTTPTPTTTYPVPVYHYNRTTFAKYFPGMERLSERHRRAPLSRAIRGAVDRPGKHEMATKEMVHVIATITGLLTASDERGWNQGWDIAMQTLSKPVTRPILETALLENAIQLARALEENGRVSEAAQLMRLVTRSDLAAVSPSEPNLVERMTVAHITSLCSTPASNQKEHTKAIDRSVHFYVAAFHLQPPSDMDSALSLGLKLVPLVVDIGLCDLASKLVTSCAETDPRFWELQNLYLSSLLRRGAPMDAIDHFLKHYSRYPECLPYKEQVRSIVDATVQLEGLRSGAVIEFLVGTPWARDLPVAWITKLLACHWKHTRNYAKSKVYFEGLVEHCEIVSSPATLRTMIQIAFAAGETDDAHDMLKEYEHVSRGTIKKSIPILGTLALTHAAKKEWEEVKIIFSKMVDEAKASMKDHPRSHTLVARALPPVVKEFAKSHTLEETVSYVKFFLGDLEVQVDKYIVTVLAKQYVMKHDVRGLLEWLGFCASRGFANDPAFLTAILSSCRTWGYGVTKIMMLAKKIHRLNPCFDRRVYMNIVRDAAADSKATKLKSLRLAVEPVEMGNERAVCRAMVAAIRRGIPQTAMEIYSDIKSAEDMDRSGSCLREAIRASILHENGNSSGALALLRQAQQRGQNIVPSLIPILSAHLDMLPSLVDPVDEFLRIVQNMRTREGIILPSTAFTLGSYKFLRAHRFQDAVRFCRVAMEMDGSPGVANTKHHFAILTEAYAMTGQMEDLRALFISVKDHSYKTEASCLRSLRRIRHKLMVKIAEGSADDAEIRQVVMLLGNMIRVLRAERANIVGQASLAEAKALQIMMEAAQSAVARPVALREQQPRPNLAMKVSRTTSRQSSLVPAGSETVEVGVEKMQDSTRSATKRPQDSVEAVIKIYKKEMSDSRTDKLGKTYTRRPARRNGEDVFDSDNFDDASSTCSDSASDITTLLYEKETGTPTATAAHAM